MLTLTKTRAPVLAAQVERGPQRNVQYLFLSFSFSRVLDPLLNSHITLDRLLHVGAIVLAKCLLIQFVANLLELQQIILPHALPLVKVVQHAIVEFLLCFCSFNLLA